MSLSRRQFVKLGAAMGGGVVVPASMVEWASAFSVAFQGIAQDPLSLVKYRAQLPVPGLMPAASAATPNYYKVGMYQFKSRVHPDMKATTVWGYRPVGFNWKKTYTTPQSTWLGPSFAIQRGTRTKVEWQNHLIYDGKPIAHPLPVDPSLMWADPYGDSPAPGFTYPINGAGLSTYNYTLESAPMVVHTHGGEQPSGSDGHFNSWFTPNTAAHPQVVGPTYAQGGDVAGQSWDPTPSGKNNVYPMYNDQLPATIWYHDHTLGLDRLNVYMGLAGAYVIYDTELEPLGMPFVGDGRVDRYGHPYDMPLVIQDRMFDVDGQLLYPADTAINPDSHPFWIPEFFGDTITVNGAAWPNLRVEPRRYRFRVLNGSNARFYNLKIENQNTGVPGPNIRVIATDGGFLGTSRIIDFSAGGSLVIGPGERYEILVNFRNHAGQNLILTNSAGSPFPDGDPVDPNTTAKVMRFRVSGIPVKDPSRVAAVLNSQLSTFPSITTDPSFTRSLTLNEVEGPLGPESALLNNTPLDMPTTETLTIGDTEIFEIINTTVDAHPIHTHLVQFQILSRQTFDQVAFMDAYAAAYGGTVPAAPDGPPMPYDQPGTVRGDGSTLIGGNPDITPFLTGSPADAELHEQGWKDTVVMLPGEVTRFITRVAPNDDTMTEFPFDAAAGPGYVWHCHILEHEENDMMRQLMFQPPAP